VAVVAIVVASEGSVAAVTAGGSVMMEAVAVVEDSGVVMAVVAMVGGDSAVVMKDSGARFWEHISLSSRA
jgi:hypothetical protein